MAEEKYNNPGVTDTEDDKRNLEQLRMGQANQAMVNAAYLGARTSSSAANWMNMASKIVNPMIEQVKIKRAAEKLEKDNLKAEINEHVDTIYDNSMSLGQTYFDQAYTQVEELRERYNKAVETNNSRDQHKLKAELNQLNSTIQTAKQTISDHATSYKEDMLSNGVTPDQLEIIKTCVNEKNAIWDKDTNQFKWKSDKTKTVETGEYEKKSIPILDENNEPRLDVNGEPMFEEVDDLTKPITKEEPIYYTMDQFNKAVILRDDVTKEKVITRERTITENGLNYRKGEGEAFNYESSKFKNEEYVTEENIQSLMHDNFTNDGTFREALLQHPEWDELMFNEENFNSIEKIIQYDTTGDGKVTLEDFDPTPGDGEEGENVLTEEDRAKALEKLYDTILTPGSAGYDYETSKNLLVEFMTLRQKEAFWDGTTRQDLKDKNLFPPLTWMTPEDYLAAGGNIGLLKAEGYQYDKDAPIWIKRKEDGTVETSNKKKRGYTKRNGRWISRRGGEMFEGMQINKTEGKYDD